MSQKKSEILRARALAEIGQLRRVITILNAENLADKYIGSATNTLRSLVHQMANAIRLEASVNDPSSQPLQAGIELSTREGTYFSWWPPRLERRHIFCFKEGYGGYYANRITLEGRLAGQYWIHPSEFTMKQATGEIKPVEYVLEGEFPQEDIERIVPLIPYMQVPENRSLNIVLLRKLATKAKREAHKNGG